MEWRPHTQQTVRLDPSTDGALVCAQRYPLQSYSQYSRSTACGLRQWAMENLMEYPKAIDTILATQF